MTIVGQELSWFTFLFEHLKSFFLNSERQTERKKGDGISGSTSLCETQSQREEAVVF